MLANLWIGGEEQLARRFMFHEGFEKANTPWIPQQDMLDASSSSSCFGHSDDENHHAFISVNEIRGQPQVTYQEVA